MNRATRTLVRRTSHALTRARLSRGCMIATISESFTNASRAILSHNTQSSCVTAALHTSTCRCSSTTTISSSGNHSRSDTSTAKDASIEHASTEAQASRMSGHHQDVVKVEARVALKKSYTAMATAVLTMLEDRRACYRDKVVYELLQPHRDALRAALLAICTEEAAANASTARYLSLECVRSLKAAWNISHNGGGVVEALEFYTALLSSALTQSDRDVRLVLDEMQGVDLLEPTADIYKAVLISQLFNIDVRVVAPPTSSEAKRGIGDGKEGSLHIVVGEQQEMNRAAVGDLCSHYFGHALAQLNNSTSSRSFQSADSGLWETFFVLCAVVQVAPKLMDLWWKKFLDFHDEQARNKAFAQGPSDAEMIKQVSLDLLAAEEDAQEVVAVPKAALPYHAIHAVLSWCAANRDIERSMKFFHEANSRGLFVVAGYSHSSDAMTRFPPRSLTTRSTDHHVQLHQLRLLVKLIAATKSLKMDGGVRELAINDVRKLIDADVLRSQASWGVVNDLLCGLSMPSAMRLVKLCSSSRSDGDEAVPFLLWASLLRRCAKDHHLDEADALFLFIRKRFKLTSPEKREMVEIMMRMYATLATPDYASAMNIFLEHVLHAPPPGEPRVKPDVELYKLLIRSADSRNAAMMTFLESCAAGVGMDEETFEALLASNPYSQVSSLSRKLPHEYRASKLDAQLRIPANVDAHLRREEALRARGRPIYDSTGEAA